MSPIAIGPFTQYQGGPEVTPGTAVAATRNFSLEKMSQKSTGVVYRPQLTTGLLIDNPGGEMVIERGFEWTASGPLIYDEVMRWLSMCVATPVITGTNPYTYTFTRNATSAPTLTTWTLERRLTDGTNHIDNEWAYCLAQSIKFTAALGEPIMMEVNGTARSILSSTMTPALARVTVEIPPALISAVWLDSTWANLGVTQVTGQVLEWEVTLRSGVTHHNTMDARTALDFATHSVNGREVGADIKVRYMVKADSGQYAAEKTAFEAQTLRAFRFKALGTSSKEFTIDMLAKGVADTISVVDEEDGYMVFDAEYISSTDLTNALRVVNVNAQATL